MKRIVLIPNFRIFQIEKYTTTTYYSLKLDDYLLNTMHNKSLIISYGEREVWLIHFKIYLWRSQKTTCGKRMSQMCASSTYISITNQFSITKYMILILEIP